MEEITGLLDMQVYGQFVGMNKIFFKDASTGYSCGTALINGGSEIAQKQPTEE